MSNLRTYKAICDTNTRPCPPPKFWSQDHESKSRWICAKTRYCLILVLELVSSFTSVRTPSPVPLFIVFPSHFNDSFGNMHRPDTCPTALKSHKSRTPLVHHFIPFYSTISGLEPQNPVPSTRPLLLHCQCYWFPSWGSSPSCWLSMLRQGPAAKKDVKLNHVKSENLQGDLRH